MIGKRRKLCHENDKLGQDKDNKHVKMMTIQDNSTRPLILISVAANSEAKCRNWAELPKQTGPINIQFEDELMRWVDPSLSSEIKMWQFWGHRDQIMYNSVKLCRNRTGQNHSNNPTNLLNWLVNFSVLEWIRQLRNILMISDYPIR